MTAGYWGAPRGDAVAPVLSVDAGERLAREAAAADFVRDVLGQLKAIAADTSDSAGFIEAAKTRQWAREPKLGALA